jgi:epoxyqueuosine reductase
MGYCPAILTALLICCYHYCVMKTLNRELLSFLTSNGASLIGFADLKEIDTNARDGFPSAISIGVALNPQVMSAITEGPTAEYYTEYKKVNDFLDNLGQKTAEYLLDKGYKAKARPATFEEDKTNLAAKLPHKTAATRAGLGWIGKSNLLITKKYGSAIRLITVLTDAPLEAGKPVNESLCAHCTRCIEACPAKAHTGKNWEAGMPREALVDVFACREKARSLSIKSFGERVSVCGLCIVVCPWTKKYMERAA